MNSGEDTGLDIGLKFEGRSVLFGATSLLRLASAYLLARRRLSHVHFLSIVVTNDETSELMHAVDFGPPSEWAHGVASRVMDGRCKVHQFHVRAADLQHIVTFVTMNIRPSAEVINDNDNRKSRRYSMVMDLPPLLRQASTFLYPDDWTNADQEFMTNMMDGVTAVIGQRSSMEDSHIICKDFDKLVLKSRPRGNMFTGKQSYYAVFDGHSGSRTSEYLAQNLHLDLANALASETEGVQQTSALTKKMISAIRSAANRCEDFCIKDAMAQTPSDYSGACAVLSVFCGKQMYIAHTGDCKAILCRAGKAIELTRDHNTKSADEVKRVEEAGGSIEYGYLNGQIEVTRGFGDIDRDTGKKMKGMICTPEIKKHYITPDDEFLLLACDGLFEGLDIHQAVAMIRHSLQKDNDVQTATAYVTREALRKSGDNITCVVVGFGKMINDELCVIAPEKRPTLSNPLRNRANAPWRPMKKVNRSSINVVNQALTEAEIARLHAEAESRKDTLVIPVPKCLQNETKKSDKSRTDETAHMEPIVSAKQPNKPVANKKPLSNSTAKPAPKKWVPPSVRRREEARKKAAAEAEARARSAGI